MRIFTEFDGEIYRLMCDDDRMAAAPCGCRLFRAPPHPNIAFEHATMEAAEADTMKLRSYLAGLAPPKISKKQQREFVA